MLLPGVVLTVVFKYGSMFGIVMAFQKFDIFKGTFFGQEWASNHGFGNFIYLCNVEITKAFLRGRSHFPAPDDFAFKYCDGPSNLCEVASLLLNSSKSRAVAIFLSL